MKAPAAESAQLVPWPESLTRREKEIARLVCEGHGRSAVVEMLGISPRTFDSHRYEVMLKIGVSNEVQLVRVALAAGWVALTAEELKRRPPPP